MKLYHGTTEAVARKALTEGLVPRGALGIESTWDVESHPECIYLTNAYAGYFAANATELGDRWGIVEIDSEALCERYLLPDEDFLEQATRRFLDAPDSQFRHLIDQSMADRTKWFRAHIHQFADMWKLSIENLGNCAYWNEIPPEAITRVSIYDPRSNPTMTSMALDPQISIMNYSFCGAKYRNLVQWFVGEELAPSDLMLVPVEALPEGAKESWQEAIGDKKGLEVISV